MTGYLALKRTCLSSDDDRSVHTRPRFQPADAPETTERHKTASAVRKQRPRSPVCLRYAYHLSVNLLVYWAFGFFPLLDSQKVDERPNRHSLQKQDNTSFRLQKRNGHLSADSLTCTKTVKKMTVMVAVRNMSFMGKSSLDSRNANEKAMAPLNPPYATMNWSLPLSFTIRYLLMMNVKPTTPAGQTEKHAVNMDNTQIHKLNTGARFTDRWQQHKPSSGIKNLLSGFTEDTHYIYI